jgi:exodeoxyribonuclease VII small subunit
MAKETESYASLNEELEQIINMLHSDDVSIDEALKYYERGVEIIEALERQIKDAKNKVHKIKQKFDKE